MYYSRLIMKQLHVIKMVHSYDEIESHSALPGPHPLNSIFYCHNVLQKFQYSIQIFWFYFLICITHANLLSQRGCWNVNTKNVVYLLIIRIRGMAQHSSQRGRKLVQWIHESQTSVLRLSILSFRDLTLHHSHCHLVSSFTPTSFPFQSWWGSRRILWDFL